jgi:hypothetical protein
LRVLINRFDGLLGFAHRARHALKGTVSSAAKAYEFVFSWGVFVN